MGGLLMGDISVRALTASQRGKYAARLFTSHDYRLHIDILTLAEKPVGTATFLDGQVDLVADPSGVRRTCSLTLSDPAGAMDFRGSSTWSTGAVWLDRLIRVRHVVNVPGVGNVVAIPFIGAPTTIARTDASLDVELNDKSWLAMSGCAPYQVNKGMNAVNAIRAMLSDTVGEFRFRLPSSSRRLSRDYAAGWDDSIAPWLIAKQIAERELGMQLIMSCDGYVTLRKMPAHPSLKVPTVTSPAAHSVDFTAMKNIARVLGKQTSKTKGTVTTTSQPLGVAIATGQGAPSVRNGQPIYRPVLVSDDSVTTVAQAKAEAVTTLSKNDRLQDAPTFTCIPFFDREVDDKVQLEIPGADLIVRLGDCSIPLGVGGDMSIGTHWPVSRKSGHRTHGTSLHTRTVKPKKPKKHAKKAVKHG